MRTRLRWWMQRGLDVLLPVGVAGFTALLVLGEPGTERHSPAVTLLGLLAALAHGAALCWRRSRPGAVMAVALAGGAVVQVLAPEGIFPWAGLVAVASFASAYAPVLSLPALAALMGVAALALPSMPEEEVQFAMAVAVVPWALGEASRNRRRAVAEASRRAVAEEQARIARELHDVLAHSVSVVVVQAAAADDVFDERPDQARQALRSIEATAREALGELRRLLAAVEPGRDDAPAWPQPGLDRLAELAAPLRAAGLDVALSVERAEGAAPLPAGVELSVYRIVQEALTNVLRHAGAQSATVAVRTHAGGVDVDVVDDGRGQARGGALAGGGRGIPGMRERAALLGGALQAGPEPDGGFGVHARLPLEAVG